MKPVREIKAIRLLFSESIKTDETIKKLFKEYIGPLGEMEFEDLKKSQGITFNSVREYILSLLKKKIISAERAKEFKDKVAITLRGEKEGKINNLKSPEKKFAEAFENKQKEEK